MLCVVNLSPHPSGVGVNVSDSEGRGKKRRSFTLSEKKRPLYSMDQRLNMGKVSEFTRISP